MRLLKILTAVVAIAGLSAPAQAGLFGLGGSCKGCACTPDCQPECCKPVICRPCCPTVHTYQRRCSDLKPPCCCDSCGDSCGDSCCPEPQCCCPEPQCCCPEPTCCCPEPTCCCPEPCCEPNCCCPEPCCDSCCGEGCCGCDCCGDPCELACLIYTSMTACYAKDRRRAVHKIGDNFNCCCNPEIMSAFIYGLNDAVESVRAKAADEIGDQIRKNCCCCTPEVVAALKCALADCDWRVRRQAEEALELCGYEICDGCCDGCCDSCGCCPGGDDGLAPAEAPAPAGDGEAAPAPAPPSDAAYFPSNLREQHTVRGKVRPSLAGLFGLLR